MTTNPAHAARTTTVMPGRAYHRSRSAARWRASVWKTACGTALIALALAAVAGVDSGAVPAQQSTPARRPMKLTPQDYIDIQQLSARYAFLIDMCSNGGYDFADLFTDDGGFSVSQQWGVSGNAGRSTGREALAAAGGGDGKGGCRDPQTLLGYGISHLIVNHVITPTADGATGRSYLLAIGVGGDPTKIERQGGYEDVYVKTAAGWRF